MENFEKIAVKVIDHWLDYLIHNSDLPGAQICIRKKGEILLSRAYGLANIEKEEKFTPRQLCHIASHSKMFSSCAAIMLAEEGKLSLGDPAVKYIPDLKAHRDKRMGDVTVRDLMSHRAGLIRDGEQARFWAFERPFPSRKQLIEEVLASDLIYDPNTITKYSNYGTGLLGLVVEAVSGQPFDDFVRLHILKKLPRARIFPDYPEDKASEFADGHSRVMFDGKRHVLRHATTGGLLAATGFCANAEGISQFFYEYFLGDKLISKKSQTELQNLSWPIFNSKEERYGLCLQVNNFANQTLVGHAGSFPGFTSQSRTVPGSDYVVSLIVNTNLPLNDFMRNIFAAFNKIEAEFDARDLKDVTVSSPMMGLWGSVLFVAGKKKAIEIPLDTTMPIDGAAAYDVKNDSYVLEEANGYHSPGETVSFKRTSSGAIREVNYAGIVLRSEKAFQKKLQTMRPA